MSKRCNTQAIFLRKDVAREDFGMVAGPPPKRQAGETDASGMRAWGDLDDSWAPPRNKGKGDSKGWGKSWRDSWDDRGDYFDDMDGYGYGKSKGKGWGKDSGKGKNGGKGYGGGYGGGKGGGYGGGKGGGYGGYGGKGKGKNNGYSNSAPYSMHDERGDDDRGYTRERSPRRGSAGSFGGRWKHDMHDTEGKGDLDEFRNFGGREPRKGKGKGGKGKNGKGKPADPKQLDQELSKYFGKEADGLEKEHLDGELESYMGKEKEKVTKETKETDAKEKPAETAEK